MHKYPILDEQEAERNSPIYAITSINFLRYSLSSVFLWIFFLLIFGKYIQNISEIVPSILLLLLYAVPVIITVILGVIGLRALVLSYQKREERSASQKIDLPIFGVLVILLFVVPLLVFCLL